MFSITRRMDIREIRKKRIMLNIWVCENNPNFYASRGSNILYLAVKGINMRSISILVIVSILLTLSEFPDHLLEDLYPKYRHYLLRVCVIPIPYRIPRYFYIPKYQTNNLNIVRYFGIFAKWQKFYYSVNFIWFGRIGILKMKRKTSRIFLCPNFISDV